MVTTTTSATESNNTMPWYTQENPSVESILNDLDVKPCDINSMLIDPVTDLKSPCVSPTLNEIQTLPPPLSLQENKELEKSMPNLYFLAEPTPLNENKRNAAPINVSSKRLKPAPSSSITAENTKKPSAHPSLDKSPNATAINHATSPHFNDNLALLASSEKQLPVNDWSEVPRQILIAELKQSLHNCIIFSEAVVSVLKQINIVQLSRQQTCEKFTAARIENLSLLEENKTLKDQNMILNFSNEILTQQIQILSKTYHTGSTLEASPAGFEASLDALNIYLKINPEG